MHRAGRQRGRRRAPFDLRDHQAAGVARGERQIERAERRGLVLHRDVAAGVGGGAANDRHVRPQRAKVQPLVAIELDHAHEVLARGAVHLAALPARIDESVEPDLREDPCPARGPGAQHIEDQAARQIVCLDRVFQDQPPDRRHRQRRRAARIAAGDDALEQAGLRQMVDPGNAVHVPGADRVQRGQSARPPLTREALADRAHHPVGRIQAAGRADRDDGPVRDQARGCVRTHCLRQRQTRLPAALCPRPSWHGSDARRSLPLSGRGTTPYLNSSAAVQRSHDAAPVSGLVPSGRSFRLDARGCGETVSAKLHDRATACGQAPPAHGGRPCPFIRRAPCDRPS